jgi:hypothetical protein
VYNSAAQQFGNIVTMVMIDVLTLKNGGSICWSWSRLARAHDGAPKIDGCPAEI